MASAMGEISSESGDLIHRAKSHHEAAAALYTTPRPSSSTTAAGATPKQQQHHPKDGGRARSHHVRNFLRSSVVTLVVEDHSICDKLLMASGTFVVSRSPSRNQATSDRNHRPKRHNGVVPPSSSPPAPTGTGIPMKAVWARPEIGLC
ncbi:hypothetical protein CTA1_6922 [Colletotrichum tanaceti]|uniref:Uncharacterized protein n=1 Tax=Colletotrichum tanaceti TaxID=1306861 RepID=A0A4V6DH66_9PEZI|nr:hypothetical protein CTA1_6922 [Colletotrichum tanaceti]